MPERSVTQEGRGSRAGGALGDEVKEREGEGGADKAGKEGKQDKGKEGEGEPRAGGEGSGERESAPRRARAAAVSRRGERERAREPLKV